MRTAASLYGAAVMLRRRWYARESGRLRLARPVISVGSLRVGGSGETPMTGYIARLLLESGERPAVLSRGYGRRLPVDEVTVVSDGASIRAGVDQAGDEPLMLARLLSGVAVVVDANRHRAGQFAEQQLGATVHILDDGFQHVELERDLNLLLVGEDDLQDRPLPAGRLREPISAAAAADAVLVTAGDMTSVTRVRDALALSTAFRVARELGQASTAGDRSHPLDPAVGSVFAVAGVARPERFFADLRAAGWQLGGTLAFRDHHRYTASDVDHIARAATAASTVMVLTTEKDLVRLEAHPLAGLPLAAVPLTVRIEPADAFRSWLLSRLAERRQREPKR